MRAQRCSRLWEVEAARDGRLERSALSAWQRHAAGCECCGAECDRLQALARRLRADTIVPDEVSLRRARRLTLERAAALMHERAGAGLGLRWAWLAMGISALAVVGVALSRVEHRTVIVTMPLGSDTKWTRYRVRNIERVDLSDGVLSLVVRRRAGDPRVLVRVPEGEIEDLGTVFKVTVRRSQTAEIAVTQGAVVFHRRGRPDLRLSAGTVWTPPEDRPRASQSSAAPQSARAPNLAPAPRKKRMRGARSLAHTQPAASALAETRVSPEPIGATPAVALDFAAEDAAYLRILALLREGRSEEARPLASAYLRRFPNGFRYREIERVAQPAARR